MVAGSLALAVRAEAVPGRRRPFPAPGSLVRHIGPQAAGPGAAVAGRQQGDRRIVGVQDRGAENMGPDPGSQGLQPPGDMADPIGHGSALDLDALPRQDRRLAIERQAVQVFADHDMGQQPGAGAAPCDRQVGGRRLHDGLAGPAGEPGADMTDHFQARRDLLQHFRHILAQAREAGAAASRAHAGRIMHHLLTRQVRGQGATRPGTPVARRACRILRGGPLVPGTRPCSTFLQVLQQQLELLDPAVQCFRRAAELQPPQLRQLDLVLLDQQPCAGQLCLHPGQFSLPLGQAGAEVGDLPGQIGSRIGSGVGSSLGHRRPSYPAARLAPSDKRALIRYDTPGITSGQHHIRSAGRLGRPGPGGLPPVDPLEQHRELCTAQRDRAVRRPRPDEAAPLQPLRE